MSRDKHHRRRDDRMYYDMHGDGRGYPYGDPRSAPYMYDNGGYMYPEPQMPATRFTGMFSSFPFYGGHPNGSLKRSDDSDSDDFRSSNKRRKVCIAVVGLASILICGAIAATIAVILTSDSSSSSQQTEPLTEVINVTKTISGEATLKDREFVPELNDPTSRVYQETATEFCDEAEQNAKQDPAMADKNMECVVTGFRSGSVIIDFAFTIIAQVRVAVTTSSDSTSSDSTGATTTQSPEAAAVLDSFTVEIVVNFVAASPMVNADSVTAPETTICESESPCQNGGTCTGSSTYLCTCAPGYTDINCTTDINDCGPINPCQNGGECTDQVNGYTCNCAPGYSGTTCAIDVNECESGPCNNGGECTDQVNGYTCTCTPGYTDDHCDTDINECAPDPCENGGSCTQGIDVYTCECVAGYTGVNCQTNFDECQSSPCQNGGSCFDGINSYTCSCALGFTGTHCDININECASNPCINGGSCEDGENRYTCTCSQGYTGINCETNINDCSPNPCANNGMCSDLVNDYTCACMPGYTGKSCQTNINECASVPCLHGSTCIDRVNMYICSCTPGYTGVSCETEINECAQTPCLNNGICTDIVNNYTCACNAGYSGRHCELNIDDCETHACQHGAQCMDLVAGYECICLPGYVGQLCQTNSNECVSNPCLNNGACVDEVNGYTCTCAAGWGGIHCETDINECASGPCDNGGQCTDGVNGYTCSCAEGFEGTHCEININECASGPCQNGGDCADQDNGYLCTCDVGFEGTNCETNTDDCASTPCLNGGQCADEVNGYVCTCADGFEGTDCETNTDDCASTPCLNGGQCSDEINGYICTCADGYEGTDCETNTDDCADNPCLNGGQCSDEINGYVCTCTDGYEGTDCETKINECDSGPCQHGVCTDLVNGYFCACNDGYEGTNCEIEIDECASNPCLNGASCVNEVNTFWCICSNGYQGAWCEIAPTTSSPPTTSPVISSSTSSSLTPSSSALPSGSPDTSSSVSPTVSSESPWSVTPSASPNTTLSVTPAVTQQPATTRSTIITSCPDGYEMVEMWGVLPFNYSSSLQDNSSADYIANVSYVNNILTAINTTYWPAPFNQTEIVVFQALNGSSNATVTVRACVLASYANISDLYYIVGPFTSIYGVEFLGAQVISSPGPVPHGNFSCPQFYYTCLSTIKCIPYGLFCNGITDCVNGEDEVLCTSTAPTPSSSTEQPCEVFQCANGICLPYPSWICDGDNDCLDNTDEMNCNSSTASPSSSSSSWTATTNSSSFTTTTPSGLTCAPDEWQCTEIFECHPGSWRCDDYIDCDDSSDEDGCYTGTCAPDYWQCPIGLCIPLFWLCDSWNDCGDLSDELEGCRTSTTTTTTIAPCTSEEFTCYTVRDCINKTLVCDGNFDCEDRSDEWRMFCPSTPEPRPTDLEIRLKDGEVDTTDQLYGRVEVRPAGSDAEFGTVCDDMFGIQEAETICRQLGYTGGSDEVYMYGGAWFGMGTGPIYLTNLQCTGQEPNVMECASTAEWNDVFCGHNQDASVSCGTQFTTSTPATTETTTSNMTTQTTTTSVPGQRITLMYGDSCLSGIILVTNDYGTRGTVCDDSFDDNEALVACNMLGFPGAPIRYGNYLGSVVPSNIPIIMDDLDCVGTESSLFDCDYDPYDDCSHWEDVAIICQGNPYELCVDDQVEATVNCSFNEHNCSYARTMVSGSVIWGRNQLDEFNRGDPFMVISGEEGSARLISPEFDGTSESQSVSFLYQIIDSHSQNLRLILDETTTDPDSNVQTTVWESSYLRSDEDSVWLSACVNTPTSDGAKLKLIFEGTVLPGTKVAVDNITVQQSACKDSLVDGFCTMDSPHECGLTIECDSCSRDSHPYRFYWTGKMIHTNSAFGEEGDTAVARFRLPYIRPNWYLRFKGLMSGVHSDELRVSLEINNREFKTIHTIYGSHSWRWQTWCVELPDLNLGDEYDLDVTFIANRGPGPFADVFLDDLELTTNACEETGMLHYMWAESNTTESFYWKYHENGSANAASLRLIDGDDKYEGLLQIYHNDEWRYICDWRFDTNDLRVACRELGFSDYSYETWRSVYDDVGFWLSDLGCTGSESSLAECNHDGFGNTYNCDYNDHVFIVCAGTRVTSTSYFSSDFFSIEDSNIGFGNWASLTSSRMVSGGSSLAQKFSFQMHKMTHDHLKVWYMDDTMEMSHMLLMITDTTEFEEVCVEFEPAPGSYVVGVSAVKSGNMETRLEIKDFEISHGYCKDYIGLEKCDFQSEYVGCHYQVEGTESECEVQYKWSRVDMVSGILDYTLQSSLGRFMYINKKLSGDSDTSLLRFDPFDLPETYIPFVCSLRFAYFVVGGSLGVQINGRTETVTSLAFKPYMWRQGCLMIDPGINCPVQSGTMDFAFDVSQVEAGVDDVHISALPCSSNVDCEFENGESCGYSWLGNMTLDEGSVQTDPLEANIFTLMSPTFDSANTESCIVIENTVYQYYNLSAVVYDMQGMVLNSTTNRDTLIALDLQTVPGIDYVLFIYGDEGYFGISNWSVSIDAVHFYPQPCSEVSLPCSNMEIDCGDGSCTSQQNVCDGKRDCTNGIDEQMCICPPAYTYYWNPWFFTCEDSSCIHADLRCDGTADCADGSDEICDASASCVFNDTYYCGYTLYNFHPGMSFPGPEGIQISNRYGFAYLESPEVEIQTENCYSVLGYVAMDYSAYQTSLRFITNMSDSLEVLYHVNMDYWYYNYGLINLNVTLPAGTYSLITEAQGVSLNIVNVTLTDNPCQGMLYSTTAATTTSESSTTTLEPSTTSSSTTSTATTSTSATTTSTSATTTSTSATTTFTSPSTAPDSSTTSSSSSASDATASISDSTVTIDGSTDISGVPVWSSTPTWSSTPVWTNTPVWTSTPVWTNTPVWTSTPEPTTTGLPDDFPIVSVYSPVYGAYGEHVELSCLITGNPNYETILYWYSYEGEMITRESDIMVEEEMEAKYSISIGGTPDNQEYNLTVRFDPTDAYGAYNCTVDVVGEPDYTHLEMGVEILPLEPTNDSCSPNPIYACAESGYKSYSLPSVTGLTNHRQVLSTLLDVFYSNTTMDMSGTCQTMLQELACGLHTPNCNDQGETVHVCREHCEDIMSACQKDYPTLVMNSNEDLDYFCKFLPYKSLEECSPIYFKCGSTIETSVSEFSFRSEGFPDNPSMSPCSYMITSPPSSLRFFDWIEITVDALILDLDCDQSWLEIDGTILCYDYAAGPLVVEKSSANIDLKTTNGSPGKFVITAKYVPQDDLCGIYNVTWYQTDLLEVSSLQTSPCSKWIFVLDSDRYENGNILLDFQSLNDGCVILDENNGDPTYTVCNPDSIEMMSTNVTVTADRVDVSFVLNYTIKWNYESEAQSDVSEPVSYEIERIEFVATEASNSGGVYVYRSDGQIGIACYVYGADELCQLAGYLGATSARSIYNDNWLSDYDILVHRFDCDIDDAGQPYCEPSWYADCDCTCYSKANITCALPTVTCNFKTGVPCGYSNTSDDEFTYYTSPVFMYEPGTSLTTTFLLRGTNGDTGKVSLLLDDDTEIPLFDPIPHLGQVYGEFNVCVPLLEGYTNQNVRLKYSLGYVTPLSDEDVFNITTVSLQTEECPGVFPDDECSFDDILVCDPFIQGACSPEGVWRIDNGELVGSAMYGTPGEIYSTTLTLPSVSTPTTKYLHFSYINNGSLYYRNSLEFNVSLKTSTQDVKTTKLDYTAASLDGCVQLDMVPNEENTVHFELMSNSSLGFVIIDDVALNDQPCPHPASCNFEYPCNISLGNRTNGVNYWGMEQGLDHTYGGLTPGHFVRHFEINYPPSEGGTTTSFNLTSVPIESQYQCLRFFYKVFFSRDEIVDSNTVFFKVHANYTDANYATSDDEETRSYDIAEYREVASWKEALVPIITDDPMWQYVGFQFTVTKLFDDDMVYVDIDDISYEMYSCKYGVENLDVCTFDDHLKCLYTANCTVGSGYIWSLNWDEPNQTNAYVRVLNSYGVEGDESYVWFDVDLSGETETTFYQYNFMGDSSDGSLTTYLDSQDVARRRKRDVGNVGDVDVTRRQKRNVGNTGDIMTAWQRSDCYSIPADFVGSIFFHATRGQSDQGGFYLDDLQIIRGTCEDPSIVCDFTVSDCGYISEGGKWDQTDLGMISQTEGSSLLVPLHKLPYDTACLTFQGQFEGQMSEWKVNVATATEMQTYKFGYESDNHVSGQFSISGDTKSMRFVLPANTGDVLTSVSLTEGTCSPPVCQNGEFSCEEKCIVQDKVCNRDQDCFSGIDEDSCGFSLGCAFSNNDLCDYEDVSATPVSWEVDSSFSYTDESGNTNTITAAEGFVFTQFTQPTSAHAKLQSISVMVHEDSCLIFEYYGTVHNFGVNATYDDGSFIDWEDVSVNTSSSDWKHGQMDIGPGHVTVQFDTTMVTRGDGMSRILMNSFLLISDIRFENDRCEDVVGIPVCSPDFMLCADGSLCYEIDLHCNSDIQCPDGSDEDIETCASVFSLDCDFEEGSCSYTNKNDPSNNHLWYRQQAFRYDQPNKDHTNGDSTGHFLIHTMVQSSPSSVRNATAQSGIVRLDTESCLSLWYFMNSTIWDPNSLTAELMVSVVYQEGDGMLENLLWYDSADRYFGDWVQGFVPLEGQRLLRVEFTAKTFVPVEIWPGLVAIDGLEVLQGPCPVDQECRPNTFECASQAWVCIPNRYRCDGTAQCPDGSDEIDCDKPDHEIDLIGGDGSTGQVRAFLDGTWRAVCFISYADNDELAQSICRNLGFNGLSEYYTYDYPDTSQKSVNLECTTDGNCTAEERTSSYCGDHLGVRCSYDVCFTGEQLCPGTKFECKPAVRFCDGFQDCTGNTDEIGCADCDPDTEFECTNHTCIPKAYRCDGVAQCERDGSDEYRCFQVNDGFVTMWDRESESRKTLCYNDVNRTIAENLCRLSGSGFLELPGIHYSLDKISDGVIVQEAKDDTSTSYIHGLEIMDRPAECYPLQLECSLPECGTTMELDNHVKPYILFGDDALLGEWPHHCALLSGSGSFMCGVSYISEGLFLTAAHCVDNSYYAPYTVQCGTATLLELGEHGGEYAINRVDIHPDYTGNLREKDGANFADIAILHTLTPPLVDNYTRPVCLGNDQDWQYILSLGSAAQCYGTGFGDTELSESGGDVTNRPLKKVRLQIVDRDYCDQIYLEWNTFTHDDSICVASPLPFGQMCFGDSGSALVCKDPRNGRWKQFGIVSYGTSGSCFTYGTPGVYNEVFSYLDWIREKTGIDFGGV